MEAAILPPMRTLANLLLGVQGDVRKHLKQAKDGYVEMDLPRLEARIARLLGRRPAVSGDEAGPASRASHVPTKAGASIHSIHSVRSTAGERSVEGRSQSAGSQDDGLGRRYIRVATDRLDALMNLAGELVVSRSRLLSRVGTLRTVQQEINFGHRRLVETVEGFSEQHEFSVLSGAAGAPGATRRGAGAERAIVEAVGPKRDGRPETEGPARPPGVLRIAPGPAGRASASSSWIVTRTSTSSAGASPRWPATSAS